MTGIIITGIICLTVVALAWIGRKPKTPSARGFDQIWQAMADENEQARQAMEKRSGTPRFGSNDNGGK